MDLDAPNWVISFDVLVWSGSVLAVPRIIYNLVPSSEVFPLSISRNGFHDGFAEELLQMDAAVLGITRVAFEVVKYATSVEKGILGTPEKTHSEKANFPGVFDIPKFERHVAGVNYFARPPTKVTHLNPNYVTIKRPLPTTTIKTNEIVGVLNCFGRIQTLTGEYKIEKLHEY